MKTTLKTFAGMMVDCEKMMADMPMMGKSGDPMMTAPAPKG